VEQDHGIAIVMARLKEPSTENSMVSRNHLHILKLRLQPLSVLLHGLFCVPRERPPAGMKRNLGKKDRSRTTYDETKTG
jgi:hypothetical protein